MKLLLSSTTSEIILIMHFSANLDKSVHLKAQIKKHSYIIKNEQRMNKLSFYIVVMFEVLTRIHWIVGWKQNSSPSQSVCITASVLVI